MHIAGTIFDSEEALKLIHLTAEVMKEYISRLSSLQLTSPSPRSRTEEHAGLMAEHASFLQVGSIWLREMAIDSMSNWSLLHQLTTELILVTMAHRQDDPITFSNCMDTLYLLSSTGEVGGKIRGLGGVDTIMSLLPRQFPVEVGEEVPQRTWTQTNNHLRFTLRTLRHLTEPEINKPYYSRIRTGVSLRAVLGALAEWEGMKQQRALHSKCFII